MPSNRFLYTLMKAGQLKTFRWFQTDDQVKCIVTLSSFIWLLYQHQNGYTALGDWDTHFFCDWDWLVKKHGCHLQQGWVLAGKYPYNSLNICPIIINGDTCICSSGYTYFQLDLQGLHKYQKCACQNSMDRIMPVLVCMLREASGCVLSLYLLITPNVCDQSKTYTPSFVPNGWRGTNWW